MSSPGGACDVEAGPSGGVFGLQELVAQRLQRWNEVERYGKMSFGEHSDETRSEPGDRSHPKP